MCIYIGAGGGGGGSCCGGSSARATRAPKKQTARSNCSRYSLYLLDWYQSTSTDVLLSIQESIEARAAAAAAAANGEARGVGEEEESGRGGTGGGSRTRCDQDFAQEASTFVPVKQVLLYQSSKCSRNAEDKRQ